MSVRSSLFSFVVVIACSSLVQAESREWTDRQGNQLKAEMRGVLNGKVVLKQGPKRQYIPLSAFSLKDRDYIVNKLTTQGNTEKIKELMAQPVVPLAPAVNPTPNSGLNGNGNTAIPPQYPGSGNPANQYTGSGTPASSEGQTTKRNDSPVTLYGMTIPSPELLEVGEPHEWTDLLGNKVSASFVRMKKPGYITLKPATGLEKDFPIVNFSSKDMDYIKQAIQDDLNREVFPPGKGFAITAEQSSKGYRSWKDRKGVTLNGKFVSRFDRKVTLEVNGATETYPYHGLSTEDQQWITNELRRRADEARAKAEAAQAARSNSSNYSSSGRGSGMSRSSGSRYPYSSNPGLSTPRIPSGPMFVYKFHCSKCGHEWTRDHTAFDTCPNCQGRGNSSSSSSNRNQYGSSSYPSSGHGSSSYPSSGSGSSSSGSYSSNSSSYRTSSSTNLNTNSSERRQANYKKVDSRLATLKGIMIGLLVTAVLAGVVITVIKMVNG